MSAGVGMASYDPGMMMPTVQAVLRNIYSGPIFEGLPPGTTWAGGDHQPMWWDARRDRYQFGLRTRVSPHKYYYTLASIETRELDAARYSIDSRAWQVLVHDKVQLLRMQHYFGMAYRRGGYC